MAEENRKRDASTAPPSLWGASARPAGQAESLKILSALQAPSAEPKRRIGASVAVMASCAVAAGVGAMLWWGASSRAPAPVVAVTTPALPPASASVTRTPAPAEAPAASAAVIENVVAEATPASAPASPVAAQPLAALTGEQAASAASVATPAAASAPKRHAKARAPVHKQATAHANAATAQKKAEAQKQAAAKDADVDLLEAMVAHVRGVKAGNAKRAQQQSAPAEAPKP